MVSIVTIINIRLNKVHMDLSEHLVKMELLELLVFMALLVILDHEDLKVSPD